GGQTFTRPLRVSFRVGVRDVHNGIILLTLDVALRPKWVTPVGAFHVAPPLIMIVERDFVIRWRKHNGACHEILLRRSWKLLFRWGPFGNRDVTGRPDKFLELRIRHRGGIHPETVHINAVHWLRVIRTHRHFMTSLAAYGRAHGKFAA